MPLPVCFESLYIDGTDIRTWANITNAEGLLSNAPTKADIIEQDWTAGAIYQKGPKGTYQFDVPVIMTSREQDVAMGQLRALQAFEGTQVTLTRTLTVNGVQVSESCQAVMTNAVEVVWNFDFRQQVRAVLIWQQLSGAWS
jgi:hypothetical protein